MNKLQENAIREYLLENEEERLDICRSIDSYDGSMDFCNTWDLEELCNNSSDAYEIARSIIYGNVNNVNDDVKYNAYGNLESVSEYDLESESESYIDEIIDFIDSNGTWYIDNTEIDEILDNDEYKYLCPICGESYEDKDDMEECYNDCKEDPISDFTCPICNETFENEEDARECFEECNKCDK